MESIVYITMVGIKRKHITFQTAHFIGAFC